MTGVLQEDPDVELVRGRAISLSQSACCRHWDIEVAGEQRLQRVSAKRVALVVGGEPKPIPWKIGGSLLLYSRSRRRGREMCRPAFNLKSR
mmetsp:Transcript_23890/g.33420  ORF Transcript_23890/g.33420 Transcript_23890/m.33420 type:complete len:91 (+) Transcript_23890:150-422(+)